MNFIFKLMAYSIILNFAVGIMLNAIVDVDGNSIFNEGQTGGLSYNPTEMEKFESGMNSTVTPQGGLQNSGDAIYRVLDMMNIGFLGRIINTVDKYMFGFVQMLEGMFGGFLTTGVRNLVFLSLRTLITFGYIMGAWMMWTGKEIT